MTATWREVTTPLESCRLFHGDCLDVLRDLPDCSVDSIVTDPPAGIRFMGRAWDSDMGGRHSWVAWLSERMSEAYRVLKPGGHALVWALPRTSHWTAWALEDAGFEVRDCVVHLYGSGFPKSLDVGKALDKRPGVHSHREFAAHLAKLREASGLSRADVSERVVGSRSGACWNWEHHQFPEAQWWPSLRDLLGLDPAWGVVLADEWATADVLRVESRLNEASFVVGVDQGERRPVDRLIKAPATDAARQWDGWGTALKPSQEMWWLATKPAGDAHILGEIGSHIARLEAECSSLASPAEKSSEPIHPGERAARTGSVPGSAATHPGDEPAPRTATGKVADSRATTAMSSSASAGNTCLSIVTSWRACWAELSGLTSTSTTSTTTDLTTDLKTLSSSLSRLTAESMAESLNPASGQLSVVAAVDGLFAACVLRLRATRTLSATEIATGAADSKAPSAGATRRGEPGREEGSSSPAAEHWWLVRKPLGGTVAATVQQWGTGALNIGACRVGAEARVNPARGIKIGTAALGGSWRDDAVSTTAIGRWPSNVILTHAAILDPATGEPIGDACAEGCVDGCPVRELDAQSGVTTSGSRKAGVYGLMGYMGADSMAMPEVTGDSGGASRFFPTFRWEAKAPASERPRINGKAHPTVKPVNLLRWMTRLVTQPGGTVLDLFAGTGTTGQAAHLEGFRSILIEQDPESIDWILTRLDERLGEGTAWVLADPDAPDGRGLIVEQNDLFGESA